MKKSIITVLFIGVMGILSVSAQEKSKPDFKKLAAKAQASVDAELKLNSATNALSTAKGDTLIVGDSAKFVVIKGMMFPVVAFTQSVPVFLSADAWGAVLEIINSRDYGKIPATTIGQIIQAIGQQLPRKEN